MKSRKRKIMMTKQQQVMETTYHVSMLVSAEAVERFDAISPVKRVLIKINPAQVGEFRFMAILANEQRYEGQKLPTEQGSYWCMTPNCNCLGFIRLNSPLEVGATIDE
jgi:hypothetical protein